MNWVKKYKLPMAKAIQYEQCPCIELKDLCIKNKESRLGIFQFSFLIFTFFLIYFSLFYF